MYPFNSLEPAAFAMYSFTVLRGGVRPRAYDLRGTKIRQASKINVLIIIIKMIEVVAVVVSSVAAALALLVTTCCYNIRRLRCATIECCGSKCSRSPMNSEELEMDIL